MNRLLHALIAFSVEVGLLGCPGPRGVGWFPDVFNPLLSGLCTASGGWRRVQSNSRWLVGLRLYHDESSRVSPKGTDSHTATVKRRWV